MHHQTSASHIFGGRVHAVPQPLSIRRITTDEDVAETARAAMRGGSINNGLNCGRQGLGLTHPNQSLVSLNNDHAVVVRTVKEFVTPQAGPQMNRLDVRYLHRDRPWDLNLSTAAR